MEQIYKRLQNGETSEAIAEEFTKALNEAMARYEAEEKARREEEAKRMKAYAEARAREDAKRTDLTTLISSALGFIAKWYPELGLTEGDWSDEDIAAIANLVLPLLDIEIMKSTAKRAKKAEAESTETVAPPRKKLPVKIEMKPFATNKPIATTDDVFADFFKSLGL